MIIRIQHSVGALVLAISVMAIDPALSDISPLYEWTGSNGRVIEAAYISSTSTEVTLLFKDREHTLSINKLAENSQQLLNRIKKAGIIEYGLSHRSPWTFKLFQSGYEGRTVAYLETDGSVLIRHENKSEAHGTWAAEGSRIVLDTNTGDRIYLGEMDNDLNKIEFHVAGEKSKKFTAKPNANDTTEEGKREIAKEFLGSAGQRTKSEPKRDTATLPELSKIKLYRAVAKPHKLDAPRNRRSNSGANLKSYRVTREFCHQES
jgi:hypothetical protein